MRRLKERIELLTDAFNQMAYSLKSTHEGRVLNAQRNQRSSIRPSLITPDSMLMLDLEGKVITVSKGRKRS